MVAAVIGFSARCRPEKTPLHRAVSENLESWLAWREAAERPVPGYVEEKLRGYLECGNSASDSPVLAARTAARRSSWHSPARAAASFKPRPKTFP